MRVDDILVRVVLPVVKGAVKNIILVGVTVLRGGRIVKPVPCLRVVRMDPEPGL